MPRLSKIGAAALAAFGWTSGVSAVSASYLVVAGGGSGGYSGGGGGAGGYLTGTVSLNPTLSYTVTVGGGGASVTNLSGVQGNSSTFNSVTAIGGGAGGYYNTAGGAGGSGGGGGANATFGTGTVGQGNNGGAGGANSAVFSAGGGGGASAVGGTGNSSGASGSGGNGTASSISGSSVTYAGGGGGSNANGSGGTAGSGGTGGGGAGSVTGNGVAGTANTGGGGGGCYAGGGGVSGGGGSGVVIISYLGAQQFGGGVVTSSGGNTIHTFQTSGTLSPLSTLSASYLIVAGGGGGGCLIGGGGGAGGLQTGSGLTIDTNSIYLVTVGAGGLGSTSSSAKGSNGTSSAFSLVSTSSIGGGGGGSNLSENGASGASGGGAAGAGGGGTGGTATQGFAGGNSPASSPFPSGGGGGAGAVGANGVSTQSGAGGVGVASSITGTSTFYAGGGGGGGYTAFSTTGGAGGSGGGGAGSNSGQGSAGTANLGGGGGGGDTGGAGGSGIVIISYAGSTQLMAGGTVTITGGNVIHTFTSSGYLTPLKLVNNSLRFRRSNSGYLSRTPTVDGSTTKGTFSFWFKRANNRTDGEPDNLYQSANTGDNNYRSFIDMGTNGGTPALRFYGYDSGGTLVFNLVTTALYRDPAAWYHVVCSFDTTQATSSNRGAIYVNGVQQTALSTATYPSQNANLGFFKVLSNGMNIGSNRGGNSPFLDGYLAEYYAVDGQALTPNSFGTFNSYGVWQPITYGGSYGTNGFYLPFTNKTSTTTLGYDFSPNGNNWTTNNISLTTGSTYDSMTDVPTLTSATAANYAVLNPLDKNTAITTANGNLSYTASNDRIIRATMGVTSGAYYWEFTPGSGGNPTGCGAIQASVNVFAAVNLSTATSGVSYLGNGNKAVNGTASAYGASYTSGDVIGVALNVDTNTLTFYKNNTSQGAITITSGLQWFPAFDQNTGTNYVNFGQQPWIYSPPSGFVALNTYNL